MESKNIVKIVGGIALLIILVIAGNKLFEEVDAGEFVVVQYPTGTLSVKKTSGIMFQGLGKATHYKKSNQFWYLSDRDKTAVDLESDSSDNSLPAVWTDGGKSKVSGSARYDMPTSDDEILKLHSIFGSQESVERQLVKTNMEKAIFSTGPLMTSKESYAERRNDLISLIEDQANKGVYRTRTIEKDTQDPLTGEVKKDKFVEVLENNGQKLRQEKSTIAVYGLRLYNVAIKNIRYDDAVEKQIKTQQQSIMA